MDLLIAGWCTMIYTVIKEAMKDTCRFASSRRFFIFGGFVLSAVASTLLAQALSYQVYNVMTVEMFEAQRQALLLLCAGELNLVRGCWRAQSLTIVIDNRFLMSNWHKTNHQSLEPASEVSDPQEILRSLSTHLTMAQKAETDCNVL